MSCWQQPHKGLWLLVIIPFWYLQRLLTISKRITSDYLFPLTHTVSSVMLKNKSTLFINMYTDSTKQWTLLSTTSLPHTVEFRQNVSLSRICGLAAFSSLSYPDWITESLNSKPPSNQPTNALTHSMEQSPSWEALSSSDNQEIPCALQNLQDD